MHDVRHGINDYKTMSLYVSNTPIDCVVHHLYNGWTYCWTILTSEKLLSERVQEFQRRQRARRATLTKYLPLIMVVALPSTANSSIDRLSPMDVLSPMDTLSLPDTFSQTDISSITAALPQTDTSSTA